MAILSGKRLGPVFTINQGTGEPTLIQNVDTPGDSRVRSPRPERKDSRYGQHDAALSARQGRCQGCSGQLSRITKNQ